MMGLPLFKKQTEGRDGERGLLAGKQSPAFIDIRREKAGKALRFPLAHALNNPQHGVHSGIGFCFADGAAWVTDHDRRGIRGLRRAERV
jgi:hypothetical protein